MNQIRYGIERRAMGDSKKTESQTQHDLGALFPEPQELLEKCWKQVVEGCLKSGVYMAQARSPLMLMVLYVGCM